EVARSSLRAEPGQAGQSTSAETRPALSIESVGKRFDVDGERFVALDDLNFEVSPGEFVCIVGPSGCGKSTLLMATAGLVPPASGRILADGEPVTAPSPSRGVVFQEGAVLPWRSVLRNVTYGLEMQHWGTRAERSERARKLIRLVGLSGFEHRLPKALSG